MQIDGNAAQSPGYPPCIYGTPCDYWNLLNGTGGTNGTPGNGSSAGHSIVRTFINGLASTDSFTSGGSKDFYDLTSWKWSTSPTPNKDTLNAGYGALYAGSSSDYVLMFGADRASPNGDANIGIWFFQNTVSLNPNGTFNGVHKDNDVFAISAFTGGGGNSAISVYKWDHTCTTGVKNPTDGQCADSNLRLIHAQASSVNCAGSLYCAVTNAATTNTTWEGNLGSPLFFQGGINLSSALGGNLPCFSSFLEETRSSQSTSAVLKDFVLGGFPVCGMSVTKTCDSANPPALVNDGTQVSFSWTGTVTNTGVGTLTGLQVNDTLPGSNTVVNPPLMLNGSAVTSLAAGQTATYSISATLAQLSATNTANATATVGGQTIHSMGPDASATCTTTVSSSISVVKSCVAPGPLLVCGGTSCVVQVPFKAHVCNLGSVQLTNITLADNPASLQPLSSIAALDPAGDPDGNDCADVSGTYQPTSANGDGATNGRYTFTDTVSVTGATAALGSNPQPVGGLCPAGALACAQATCAMCNVGECTTTPLQ
ncbi:hypothetical protein [Rudaea sp.]|uniref:hypothetical protein n=1 Tax=Rudaea sp. TaxID=2136325 RepID=UPI002ED037AA